MLQAHGLDREMLQKREVVKIDIANDPVDRRVCIRDGPKFGRRRSSAECSARFS